MFGGMRLDRRMASVLRLQRQSAFQGAVVDLEAVLLQGLGNYCMLSCRLASSESTYVKMARDGKKAILS